MSKLLSLAIFRGSGLAIRVANLPWPASVAGGLVSVVKIWAVTWERSLRCTFVRASHYALCSCLQLPATVYSVLLRLWSLARWPSETGRVTLALLWFICVFGSFPVLE